MKVNQHQIIAFNAACQHKSFSKAAAALGVTQSSVTQNVAKFEATVGAYLFERRRTGLVLTPAGKRLYRVTEEIGILHTLLDERIGEYAQLERGLLRIAGTACNPAMTYMSRFKERYPGVDGSAYVVGGLGMTVMKMGDVVIVPIRSGVGLRAGLNVGYLKFTDQPTWNPF